MTDDKDVPRTHDEIEKIADAEDQAGVVDQQAAVERDPGTAAPKP